MNNVEMILTDYLPQIKDFDKEACFSTAEYFFRLKNKARVEGILSLEEALDDDFFKCGVGTDGENEASTFFSLLLQAVLDGTEREIIVLTAENLLKNTRIENARLLNYIIGANCILLIQAGADEKDFIFMISSLFPISDAKKLQDRLMVLSSEFSAFGLGLEYYASRIDEKIKMRIVQADALFRKKQVELKKIVLNTLKDEEERDRKMPPLLPLGEVRADLGIYLRTKDFSDPHHISNSHILYFSEYSSERLIDYKPNEHEIPCKDGSVKVCSSFFAVWRLNYEYNFGYQGNPKWFMQDFDRDDIEERLEKAFFVNISLNRKKEIDSDALASYSKNLEVKL